VTPVALTSLTVRYGESRVLADLSLTVPKGSVYALLGRNGAGKTSLVRCLLGLQKPASGQARLLGEDVWRRRAALLSRVGVVPEEPDAPPDVSVERLAAFVRALYRSWDDAALRARLERFGVPLDVRFGSLSKGQKTLALLALALAHSPELLVLDDPTLGLDPVARRILFDELIGDLADRGTTVFLTTHDLAGIETIADRVGVLHRGRLVLDEELETLKSRFRTIRYANEPTEERAEYGQELSRFNAVRVRVRGWGVEAVVSDYDDEAFSGFAEQAGVVDAESAALSLEEIFLAVAGEERGGKR
jgi:ABC-2 type transport system ATP-binding protein